MKKSYFYLVLLIPLFLIVLMKLCPAPAAPVEKGMSASEERARAAEERRAERREAREARKAEKAAAKAAAAQQNTTKKSRLKAIFSTTKSSLSAAKSRGRFR